MLRGITDAMQAPDAVHFAGPLMKLQTDVLDLIHGQMQGGKPGAATPGAPGAPGGQPMPPGGGAPPGAAAGLMGGLAGMQGAGQGPSAAVSPGGAPSLSGIDPAQLAGVGAGGDGS